MRHVVVTGAAGFIGGHLIRRLAADGHTVVGIDRRPVSGPAITVCGDLSSPGTAIIAALRDADAVFHLAGCPGVRTRGPHIARRRIRDNVLASALTLSLTPHATPVVLASSSSVYGGARRGHDGWTPSHEDGPRRPRGAYARSKVALERLAALRAARGGRVAVARPFTVTGPGQRSDMLVATWLRAVAAGDPLPVVGSLDRRRDLTDVDDVVEGMVRLAVRGVQATVNLGTGRAHSLRDVARSVSVAVGRRPQARMLPPTTDEPDATLAHTGRCQRLLGFVPTTDLTALVTRQATAAGIAPPVTSSRVAATPVRRRPPPPGRLPAHARG